MVILGAITLDREPASVALLRRYIRDVLDLECIDPDDAELLVSEVGSNAVDHGGGERMALLVAGDDERIRLTVTDGGGSGSVPRLRAEVSGEDERGRGLLLVDALAQKWGVRTSPDGTTVWVELPRKPGAC
jgi:anti-sigma regulatory factor (Ser/Thr protein kinase)